MARNVSRASAPVDVEYVTKRFYRRFELERAAFLDRLAGPTDRDRRETLASILLGRLMFLYFLQKGGLLGGDRDILRRALNRSGERAGDNFYAEFLCPLFFNGAGNPSLTGPDALVLSGSSGPLFWRGLFHSAWPGASAGERARIPNAAFARIFDFFDEHQWRLDDGPLTAENQINPSILGYVFEKRANREHLGAYYTKEDVTRYICRNTIIPALLDAARHGAPGLDLRQAGPALAVDDLVTLNLDSEAFALAAIERCQSPPSLLNFYRALKNLTVLDPTCGSGAFLLAALDVLAPFYEACLRHMRLFAARRGGLQTRHEAAWCAAFSRLLSEVDQCPNPGYFAARTIITRNLYGVDLEEEAVEMCRLRLLLKLAALDQRALALEPLAAISFNIRAGNAMVGAVRHRAGLNGAGPTNEMLDRYLARAVYEIPPDDRAAFENWRANHRPFHWCAEFPAVLRRGGFDVIIGNPPYVEYVATRFNYRLRGYTTLACANLYPCVVERSRALLKDGGRLGMVLPLAAFATRNMAPFIAGVRRWFPTTWVSFFHFRPAMLFSGDSGASIPTAILLAGTRGGEARFSTGIHKWSASDRRQLFSTISYCRVTAPHDPINNHYYPKFGIPLENRIMRKLMQHNPVKRYLAGAPNGNDMFYRSAGGLYWKVFVNFPWPYQTTSNKSCSFRRAYDRDVFVALFNSSLFWWYYTVTCDTFNLKDYMIFGFRFDYPEKSPAIADALTALCAQLMDDYRRHARHLRRGPTGSYTIYASRSKPIIDQIDRILARHYGLADKELDFIINYDLQYRLKAVSGKQ
jgi:hypothetical protein